MIDSHQHFWKYDPAAFAWVTDEMKILRKDYLPSDLHQALTGSGITGVVAVQATQTIEETDWLLSLAEEDPLIQGVVGWVPLVDAAVGKHLDRLQENPKFRGVREIVQGASDQAFLDNPDFHRGIRELTRREIPYDLLIFPHQLSKAERFVRQHPNQRFILDHLAKPIVGKVFHQEWADQLRTLGQHPNVTCKFSGLLTEIREATWNLSSLVPYWETTLEIFTPSRLMYGSDWPVSLLRSPYRDWLDTVQTLSQNLTTEERLSIYDKTARKAYALGA